MSGRFSVLAIVAVCVAGFAATPADGHDLRARVTLQPDSTVVQAWFSDDSPAQEAKVNILEAGGNEILSGKTDDKGVCTLRKLGAGKYTAVIESIGHRDAIEFEVSDSASTLEFYNWRMNRSLGLGIGIAVLIGGTCIFWLMRRRRSA
jgi:hypothetical protein